MEYAERLAQAKALYAKPASDDMEKQKFKRGTFVKVTDNMPSYMSHFECGFIGVVEYTYAQKYGGDDVDSYSLVVLAYNGKPVNSISWYKENQLTSIDDDVESGIKIIEAYSRGL